MVYDPWGTRTASGLSGSGATGRNSSGLVDEQSLSRTGPMDAVDLTDVATEFDDANLSYNGGPNGGGPPPPAPSGESTVSSRHHQFYLDLTRFGSYVTGASADDQTTIKSSSAASSSALRTPTPTPSHHHLALQGHQQQAQRQRQEQRDLDLISPIPPTPVPQFRVFDLTCFIDDNSGDESLKDSAGMASPDTTPPSFGIAPSESQPSLMMTPQESMMSPSAGTPVSYTFTSTQGSATPAAAAASSIHLRSPTPPQRWRTIPLQQSGLGTAESMSIQNAVAAAASPSTPKSHYLASSTQGDSSKSFTTPQSLRSPTPPQPWRNVPLVSSFVTHEEMSPQVPKGKQHRGSNNPNYKSSLAVSSSQGSKSWNHNSGSFGNTTQGSPKSITPPPLHPMFASSSGATQQGLLPQDLNKTGSPQSRYHHQNQTDPPAKSNFVNRPEPPMSPEALSLSPSSSNNLVVSPTSSSQQGSYTRMSWRTENSPVVPLTPLGASHHQQSWSPSSGRYNQAMLPVHHLSPEARSPQQSWRYQRTTMETIPEPVSMGEETRMTPSLASDERPNGGWMISNSSSNNNNNVTTLQSWNPNDPGGVESSLVIPEPISPEQVAALRNPNYATTTSIQPSTRLVNQRETIAPPPPPPPRYTLASPSEEYQNMVATNYCNHHGDCQSEDINTAFMEEEIRRSEVVVHPHRHHVLLTPENSMSRPAVPFRAPAPVPATPGPEEHSTLDMTDFSASNYSSDVPSSIDMFATDCKFQLPSSGAAKAAIAAAADACGGGDQESHNMFDTLCRGMQPADSGTLAPSVTKIDRTEIRSCGTLPMENNPKAATTRKSASSSNNSSKRKTNTKRNDHKQNKNHSSSNARKKGAATLLKPPLSPNKKGFVELPAVTSEEDKKKMAGSRRKKTGLDSQKEFMLQYDTKYRDKNCSQSSMGGSGKKEEVEEEQIMDASMIESQVDSVADRREWMGNFVRDLFDQDQTKAVFYASSIAEANMMKNKEEEEQAKGDSSALSAAATAPGASPKNRKPGQTAGDFDKVKDYCSFVLQNLDLADVLENIDTGVYDEHLDDFQEDIELCLEAAMDKHDTFMEYENRKWNSRHISDEHSVVTRMRHQNLRLLAGEELMKQLDADFRMQLLEHFCQQIYKRQQVAKKGQRLHKRQQKLRQ